MCTDHGKISRREFIYGIGTGAGSLALSSLIGCDTRKTVESITNKAAKTPVGPLAPKPAMTIPKARALHFFNDGRWPQSY